MTYAGGGGHMTGGGGLFGPDAFVVVGTLLGVLVVVGVDEGELSLPSSSSMSA
jgi:hypothetical protein